jgi:predicted phosphodiesterase
LRWAATGVAGLAAAALGQPLLLQPFTGNGVLAWDDISTEFAPAQSYTVEWAPRLEGSNMVWREFTTLPATNASYRVDVPMWFRLKAVIEPRFPRLRLAVVGDPHYMAPSLLLHEGPAFQSYLAQDPKLLRESPAILEQITTELIQARPQIVLIAGDLTKDGERVSHEGFVAYLQRLKAAGAQVFVCPGNHDINNPYAVSFDGAATNRVASISPADFAALYADFGYGTARARDPASLSYVAEPVPGLWILSMDSCHYDAVSNATSPYAGGSFDAARLDWITSQLAAARAQGKTVLGLMHHGILEHFVGQKSLFPEYVLDDWQSVAAQFAGMGLKVVFTGHYHAQDVVQTRFPGGDLYDVETGSATMYPCSYRLLDLGTNGALAISSPLLSTIPWDLGGVPFPQYAADFLAERLPWLVTYQLMAAFDLAVDQAEQAAALVVPALMAHYAGDELPEAETLAITDALVQSPEPLHTLGMILWRVWTDPPPADNQVVVPLR